MDSNQVYASLIAMALLSTQERDWLARKSFINYYNRNWGLWRNKAPYVSLARNLYITDKTISGLRGVPLPSQQSFHASLVRGLITFRTFEKLVNRKFPYDPNDPKSVGPVQMITVVAWLFAKLIIDEDWAVITS